MKISLFYPSCPLAGQGELFSAREIPNLFESQYFFILATWVRFFTNAGIPSQAASYAHIFVKNRIELDMLSELNKEYLREVRRMEEKFISSHFSVYFCPQMGITPMGDIISILRHSKTVTDQTVRDKIMAENESAKFVAKVTPSVSQKVSLKSSVPGKSKATRFWIQLMASL